MRTRPLGHTGMTCSEVSLGTWAFTSNVYGDVAREDAFGTVRLALDLGITLYDTAPLYGTGEQDGVAEMILGEALGADRGRVLISSKFGRRATGGGITEFDGTACERSVEASLARLGTDHLDVLFFHSPQSPKEIKPDVFAALARLRADGRVRCVGHSISWFQQTEGMCREWAADGRIDVVQVVLSLLNRETTHLVADLAREGVGVIARESLGNGFLSGTVTRETVFPPNNFNSRYSREEVAARVERVDEMRFLVRPPVASMPQAALRWVLDQPGVSTVLAGARNQAEIADCAAVGELPGYSAEEVRRAADAHAFDFPAA